MQLNSKYKAAFLGIVLLAASSCKKEYLDTEPTDQTTPETVFATTRSALTALNGIHRLMYSQWFGNQDQGGQSGNMIYMDAMGEDLVMTGQANGWFITTYAWQTYRNPNSSVPFYNYTFYYAIIFDANLIIQNIGGAAGTQAERDYIKGQALAYRGWAYFQMIQLFGKRFDKSTANDGLGLSLVLTPANGSVPALPRSNVAEVYTQINKDLDSSISLLGAYTRPNKSHLNLGVAKGLKARVALAQQNWPVAAQFAAEARSGYTPMAQTAYLAGFNDYTNSEWMWGSHQIADQTSYFYSFFAYMSNYSSTNTRGNPKAINSRLYRQITSTDIRKQLWDSTGTNTAFPLATSGTRKPYMNRKFLVADITLSIGDVPMMRAAEMYLIEAEARARNGQDALAAAALFTLAKARDNSYVLSTRTGQALIDEIMIQRRVELWGEGFRFYDLKRLNLPLDRTGANHDAGLAGNIITVQPGGNNWEFLLPQSELNNSNGVIIQNPQ